MRLNSNGTLDTSFGNHGVASIDFRRGGGEIATCMVLQPDGKIVIGVSFGNADAAPALVLVRLDENGAIDSSFGNSGVAALFNGVSDTAFLVQQPDGKLLTGGGMLIAEPSPMARWTQVSAKTASHRWSRLPIPSYWNQTDRFSPHPGLQATLAPPRGRIVEK